ncbi:MAG: membrane protein insertase YidC [Bacteroidia bacterium]|nr:membrane protein insertase YidC [Bacteroidia bacterium]
MDKKSYIGLALIFAIMVIFQWINAPSEEEREKWRQYHEQQAAAEKARQNSIAALQAAAQTVNVALDDTTRQSQLVAKYGLLAPYMEGEQSYTKLENNLLSLELTNKGARVYSAEIKEYKAYGDRALKLFDGDDNRFGFSFTHNTRSFFTGDIYFQLKEQNDSSVTFSANIGEGSMTMKYLLPHNSYEVHYSVETENLGSVVYNHSSALDFEWTMNMPYVEKGHKSESTWSGVYFRYAGGDVEDLGAQGTQKEEVNMKVDWVAYKDQFFSTIFEAKDQFAGAYLTSNAHDINKDTLIMKDMSANLGVKFDFNKPHESAEFSLYFLPNYFYALESYEDKEFTELLPLGWGIFGWINEYFIIPVFKYLEMAFDSYGLIILLLTIIIKTIIFPFTFSSYKSQAKMRVLKPQIDEINARIPAEKAMERQQATMNLYKKAGVNPMGGCLPMLLQMPIIFAAFHFFPAAIEFRGQSFLWADDLSTFDSIIDLPFNIPFYGAHVSLFCLLFCAVQIVYSKAQMQTQSQAMPGMSAMMYIMPIMMLFFLNDFPAALNYYYFLSMLITILQTMIIKRFFINEASILAQIEANKKKPTKKSKWQARYEELMREQKKQRK